MPQFSYRAVGRDGRVEDGSVEASGADFASRQLRARGLTPIRIDQGAPAAATAVAAGSNGAAGRQEVLSFTSELAVLLRAGLPLDKALRVLIEMASGATMSQLLDALLTAVKSGKSLSQALEPYEADFGSFYLNMLRAGEATGRVIEVLDHLVDYLERSRANRETVISALIYPAILAVVAALSILVMVGFVVPQFEALFDDMGEALPLVTRLVLTFADFLSAWGWLLAALALGLGLYLRQWSRSPGGRATIDRRILAVPVVGAIVFEFEVARFARTAGTLLASGVSLLKAISIAINTVGNGVLREAFSVLPPAVKSGRRISGSLEETGRFSPMLIQMIRVGEESGKLDKMMLELARVYDDRVQSAVKRGLTLLEPVLILGMGIIIAVIIIAILMGILSVNDLAI